MSDLVSIIIPTFNEEKNIARLLISIKNQSYQNIETIIVDDASRDKTADIAEKLGARVFKRKHAERSAQRNFGADKAKGKYLLFLDGDMELTKDVIKDSINSLEKGIYKLLVIPERTVGNNFAARVRNFERKMYMGDFSIEVARLFDKKVFFEFGGYDLKLTGPEDYDLPYRISKKYKTGRSRKYILHHEEEITFKRLLQKKYYYAKQGASYANKYPELIKSQGNILFRKAYFRNWKKFIKEPALGLSFIFVRICETLWAIAGYISAVGIIGFIKTAINSIFR